MKIEKENDQTKVFLIGFAIIGLVIIWTLFRPMISRLWNGNKTDEAAINEEIIKAPSITSEELLEKIQSKSVLIVLDLRPPGDFENGHIVASANMEAGKINGDELESFGADKTSDIVLANEGENFFEVAKIINQLVAAGYSNAKYLAGGISAWRDRGFLLVSSRKSEINKEKVREMSVQEIKDELERGYDIIQVVDIRSKDEFSREHIVGAINISLSDLEKKSQNISTIKKVVVYGANTDDEFQAVSILFDLNFFNAYKLNGGISGWKVVGGKVERGS